MKKLLSLFVLLNCFRISNCQHTGQGQYYDMEHLLSALLRNLTTDIRATEDFAIPTNVKVQMSIVNFNGFDEVEGKFSIYATLELRWYDFRMRWSPHFYGNILDILVPQKKVWKPQLTLINPHGKLKTVGHDETYVHYWANGSAYWLIGELMDTSCDADVNFFPFDVQTCSVTLSPWGYKRREVQINPPVINGIIFDKSFSPNGIWDITDTTVETGMHMASGFGHISFIFTIERRSTYFVINAFLPILLLGLLQTIVFVLPAESGERIGYVITCLLAIAVLLTIIIDNLPKTANPIPLLCFFLMADLVLATILCCFTILNLRLHMKDEKLQVPEWIQSLMRFFRCKNCPKHLDKKIKHRINDLKCCSRNHEQRESNSTPIQDIHKELKQMNHCRSEKRKSDIISVTNDREVDQGEPDVTWKDVAGMLDIVFFIFGNFCTILLVIIYLSVATH